MHRLNIVYIIRYVSSARGRSTQPLGGAAGKYVMIVVTTAPETDMSVCSSPKYAQCCPLILEHTPNLANKGMEYSNYIMTATNSKALHTYLHNVQTQPQLAP